MIRGLISVTGEGICTRPSLVQLCILVRLLEAKKNNQLISKENLLLGYSNQQAEDYLKKLVTEKLVCEYAPEPRNTQPNYRLSKDTYITFGIGTI